MQFSPFSTETLVAKDTFIFILKKKNLSAFRVKFCWDESRGKKIQSQPQASQRKQNIGQPVGPCRLAEQSSIRFKHRFHPDKGYENRAEPITR